MSNKIHYDYYAPKFTWWEINRVSRMCGAVTHHSEPQVYVKETSDWGEVTCKACLGRRNDLKMFAATKEEEWEDE